MENKYINDAMSENIIQCTKALALENGAGKLNVRTVLNSLGITNRVFYNRFSNIEQVLDIVYCRMVISMRESLCFDIDPQRDFFEQVKEIVVSTLVSSYQLKMKFNSYVFESDSETDENFRWWIKRIEGLHVCITYQFEQDVLWSTENPLRCMSWSYGLISKPQGLTKYFLAGNSLEA